MAVVERIAHRIAVVYAGQIVEIGNAAEVLANPAHSYTRQLIEAVPSLERRRSDFSIDTRAVPSLVRPLGFEPEIAPWETAGDDHAFRKEV
jgi:ABC-type dipeptide/oligopeptide/nickel transport system ATPase component